MSYYRARTKRGVEVSSLWRLSRGEETAVPKQERPDEVHDLTKRLKRLEWSMKGNRDDERRTRVGIAVMTAGAVALLVAPALPWLRGPRRNGAGFDTGPTLGSQELPLRLEPRGMMTGWEMVGAAVVDLRVVLVAFLALLLLLVLVACALDTGREGFYTAVQACALLPTLLFLVSWPRDVESAVLVGPGPMVVVVAGVMLLYGAGRAKP